MSDKNEVDRGDQDRVSLSDTVRLSEVDRQLRSEKVRQTLIRWAYLPILTVGLTAMILGLILGTGSTSLVAGGALSLAGAVAVFVQQLRKVNHELADLEEERSMLTALPSQSARTPPRLESADDKS